MKKVTLTFGLISGAIISVLMMISMSFSHNGKINFDYAELIGYASMIIALSMIFFGIKSYRDNNGGKITFLKGLQVGILIALIAALFYGVTGELFYRFGNGDAFVEQYIAHTINKMKEKGASVAEVEAATKEMAGFAEMYKNPFIRFGVTLMEIIPVGIIITLISAALLRRKELLPAAG